MAAPTVTSITPASGPPGTQVAITGTGFTNDTTSVLFGAVSAGTLFAVVSETDIVAYAPAGTGTVHVTVTTPGGTSATGSGDQFTYAASPGPPGGGGGSAPTVTSVDPDAATDNDGGDAVTIEGTGFTTTQAVFFGLAQAAFSITSDTVLAVTTPAGSGVVDVTVQNSYGTSAVSAADEFTYPVEAAPTITAIAPASGFAGTVVTITGTGFADVSACDFGAESAAFTILSATSITATAPAGSGTVDVTVTNPGGTSATSSADEFSYGTAIGPVTTATNTQPNGFTGWTAGPVTVTLTATDVGGPGIAHTYYTVDSGGQTLYSGPFAISAAGSHLVTYWSVDLNGLVEPVNVGWVNILSASAVPTGLAAVAIGTGAILVSWNAVTALAQMSYKVYSGAANPPTTLVATTGANVISVKQAIGDGGRYFAVSSVDAGGNESAKCAAVGPVTALLIQTIDIAAYAISIAKFASGIVPPRVVAALPGLPDTAYPAGSTAFLTTDGKLYKTATGLVGSWVAVVNAADMTGRIVTTQITDDAITAAKIAANTITAAEVAANTITASQIAADTITAGQIAAGAIGASEIAAGAVVAGKIAALSVVAGDIAANTITAAKIAANTITAGQIAAGTITAAQIAAGTITGSQIAASVSLSAPVITGGNIYGTRIDSANGAGECVSITDGHIYILNAVGRVGEIRAAGYDLQIDTPAQFTVSAPRTGIYGNLFASGSIKPLNDWLSATSDDGIWIQDNYDVSERVKLYYNSSLKRFGVYVGSSAHWVQMS